MYLDIIGARSDPVFWTHPADHLQGALGVESGHVREHLNSVQDDLPGTVPFVDVVVHSDEAGKWGRGLHLSREALLWAQDDASAPLRSGRVEKYTVDRNRGSS